MVIFGFVERVTLRSMKQKQFTEYFYSLLGVSDEENVIERCKKKRRLELSNSDGDFLLNLFHTRIGCLRVYKFTFPNKLLI
ncbi:hypothetical protein BpHYR1_025819 [Brachionus plicatilis]|uniref:Uncharacterized protein n=1 Tax=Brachionus plicatilis TaxID=10195 RepID=A0A3M7SLP3_BRAPC|nr:hypothetical protein BpHYR1_025819 [Brachionus plicatilis]